MPEALTPPRPASRASSRPKSPRPPSMPGLPRTTSQLSTISVQTRNHSSPRKLLSKTLEPPMAHPVEQTDESDAAALLASSSSSAHASTSSHSVSVPLSRRSSSTSLRSSRKGKEKAMDTMEGARETLRHIKLDQSESSTGRTARRYYVLTHAGKPHGTEDANLMGIVQALISIFAEDNDRIRSITKGRYQIAFVLKAPLYLFCVSDRGEPEHVLRTHLEYIHLQILSVVSSTQLARAFARRSNFDPSRLLEGTESFLTSLVDKCQYDFSYLTGTLQPLRMNPPLREAAAAALVPPSSPTGILSIAGGKTRVKDLLYVLLIADGHIVTLLRPRRHSIHPSDLHLLLNTLSSSSTLRQGETFLPICFPKFNPAGFVHAYISYVATDVGLVFVSADKEAYEELRMWKELVLERLVREKTLTRIEQSLGQHQYTTDELQCHGLIHFIYKSRQLVQITMPEWPDGDRARMVTMYQTLHDSLTRGQQVKLLYMRDATAAYLGWITRPFELYMCVSADLPKSAVVSAANVVAQWVASEESRLFLKDAPVF